MRRALVLTPWMAVWAALALAQAGAPRAVDDTAEVGRLEERRRAAMVAADTATLSGILAPDAIYVHSNGLVQTRDELFEALERGEMRYVAIDAEDAACRAYGATVVCTGVQRLEVRTEARALTLRNRYTVVYARASEGWKLVAYQSTPLPDAATRH